MDTTLATVDKFRQELANAETLDDLQFYEARVAAILELLRQERRGLEEVNKAMEMLLWTRRSLGERLAAMEKNEGVRLGGNTLLPPGNEPTYEELEIDKMEASRWQALARIPEQDFTRAIEETKAEGEPLTFSAFYNLAKQIAKRKDEESHPMSGTQATGAIAYAMIFNAVDDHDWQWLLSDQCRFYLDTLGLPHEPLISWAMKKCPSIEATLRSHYDPIYNGNGGTNA